MSAAGEKSLMHHLMSDHTLLTASRAVMGNLDTKVWTVANGTGLE